MSYVVFCYFCSLFLNMPDLKQNRREDEAIFNYTFSFETNIRRNIYKRTFFENFLAGNLVLKSIEMN